MRAPMCVLALVALAPACTPDADADGLSGAGEGEGEGEGGVDVEAEPNGGDPLTETNPIVLDRAMTGAIAAADDGAGGGADVDVFAFASTPGRAFRVRCVTDGSPLDCHLTILDAGRGGDAPGEDYVRLASAPAGNDAELVFMALGEGGHFVIVRDARAVGGDGAGPGGTDFTYSLEIDDVTDDVTGARGGAALSFPGTVDDALPGPAGLRLHPLTGVANADVTIDIAARGDADLRAFVVLDATGDWIIRNDDGTPGGTDPGIDAFFPEGGPMHLLIEAVSDDATDVGYTITTAGNAP